MFKFQHENIAAYFASTMGDASALGSLAFSKSSGTTTQFAAADKVTYNQSYELGFLMTVRKALTFKFAAEFFQTPGLTTVAGVNASNNKLFDLDSAVSVFNPSVVVEFNFADDDQSRAFAFVGAGWGKLTLTNAYTFTALGKGGALAGVTDDYTEKVASSFLNYSLGAGYETLFTDNTTFNILLGYRYMDAISMTYAYSGENIAAAGNVASGATAKFSDGTDRSLNMGGVFIGIGFRFYIETL